MTSDINPKPTEHTEYRTAVRELCARFGSDYWQRVDEQAAYPEAFVAALTEAGWLAALIPEQYGGGGLGVTEASVILEEINRSGANAGACHAQMYIMGALLRYGSDAQKQTYLPEIARSSHPWLTMETTGSTALSPSNAPPTQISTHGEFTSPRGCRGTFGSVGDAQATRIEADFTGTDCPSTFTGSMVLIKS